MTMFKTALLPAAVLTLLTGCISNLDIDNTMAMKGKTLFGESLKTEYVSLAELEREEFDWLDVGYFNAKGRAAAAGENVAPTAIAERRLPEDSIAELSAARTRLVDALQAGRTNAPPVAARAQAMFDCWMQEQEENFQPGHISRCRGEFLAAMAQLETKPPTFPKIKAVQRNYVVYFSFNESTVDNDAMTIIAAVASYANSVKASTLHISGHTDSSGSSAYNQTLARKRAAAVAQALAGKVSSKTMVDSFGENRLAISTGDGVAERRNRRVEITVTP